MGYEAAMAFLPMISSAMGAGGQYIENKQKLVAAQYNTRTLQWQKQVVQQSSDFALARLQRQKAKAYSTQHALYAKAGVRMEGSPIEVMADTATEFELDKAAEIYNTQIEQQRLDSEIKLSKYMEGTYKFNSIYQPAMTLLGGAMQSGMNYAYSKGTNGPANKTSVTGKREYIGSYAGVRK